MNNRLISGIGLMGILLLAQATCAKGECTLITCDSALEIRFMGTGMASWPAGSYTVEVIADSEKGSCEVTLPLMCGRAPTCTGTRAWTVADSGCAGPAAQHALTAVTFATKTPAMVNVLVFRVDEILGEQTFTPSYGTSHPNGEDCDPACKTAPASTMQLTL